MFRARINISPSLSPSHSLSLKSLSMFWGVGEGEREIYPRDKESKDEKENPSVKRFEIIVRNGLMQNPHLKVINRKALLLTTLRCIPFQINL